MITIPTTKASQRAVNKYMKNNYDRISLVLPKGRKAELQAHAAQREESLNGFVNRAINEAVERDNAETIVDNPETIVDNAETIVDNPITHRGGMGKQKAPPLNR